MFLPTWKDCVALPAAGPLRTWRPPYGWADMPPPPNLTFLLSAEGLVLGRFEHDFTPCWPNLKLLRPAKITFSVDADGKADGSPASLDLLILRHGRARAVHLQDGGRVQTPFVWPVLIEQHRGEVTLADTLNLSRMYGFLREL